MHFLKTRLKQLIATSDGMIQRTNTMHAVAAVFVCIVFAIPQHAQAATITSIELSRIILAFLDSLKQALVAVA